MSSTDTPMFRQYMELKENHQDSLLFFRMGDFYELFFEDARVAAKTLDLTLTSRNKGKPDAIPMCGVPHHAAAGYIQSLIEAGHKVAIGEQVEDPKASKGLVRREVVRVISPGVRLDPEALAPREPCWLVGISPGADCWGLALLDVSTGDLRVTELSSLEQVLEEVHRSGAREVVLPEQLRDDPSLESSLQGLPLNWMNDALFDVTAGRRQLCERFGVRDLEAFGCKDHNISLGVAAGLLEYARRNAGSDLSHLQDIRPYEVSEHVVIDDTTRRNLELVRSLWGRGRKGSLLGLLDRSETPMGGRLLREWMLYPLVDIAAIELRLEAVDALVQAPDRRQEIRESLGEVSDLERIGGKVAQQTATARDLVALRRSLDAMPALAGLIQDMPALAGLLPEDLCDEAALEIGNWLVEEPPLSLTEGGLIRAGVDEKLDELVLLAREGRGFIAAMEQKERESTGIQSLKIRYNKVFGYFIEVTRANLHRVPEHYLRKQTLSNAERYITPELKEFEEKVLGADERRKRLEYHHFVSLREKLSHCLPALLGLARAVGRLDALAGLAALAVDGHYVRPQLHEGRALEIRGGRHPVVERQADEPFVPNDICMREERGRLIILTGPNMSGKSTVMRQVALVVLMAQMGSFVPADEATIGICDRIFTRVGASDDLSSGRSTFMVEMSETANILRNATERSLVLLDEIGRGTSTYDGLSIAWAVAETLHDRIRCRALFATHYHELVELAQTREGVLNLSVAVSEWEGKIIFLRRLKEGGASRSYGIQCARLAGLPRGVVERAKTLLKTLEREALKAQGPQMSLFTGTEPETEEVLDPMTQVLSEIDVDNLSPRQALDVLYDLVEKAKEETS